MNRTSVNVTVTSKVIGAAIVVPFSLTEGAQTYPPGHPKVGDNPLYRISTYAMVVDGKSEYEVIRFGLQNKGTILKQRICDAGLACGQSARPTWVPGYKPHSFEATGYEGAWRIMDGKAFLIHEGPNTGLYQAGGSLGCIEALNTRWPDFLDELINITGEPWPEIGKHRLINLTLNAASAPMATLVY